jgi:hypothetical protein
VVAGADAVPARLPTIRINSLVAVAAGRHPAV